jgi:hypothetical protein
MFSVCGNVGNILVDLILINRSMSKNKFSLYSNNPDVNLLDWWPPSYIFDRNKETRPRGRPPKKHRGRSKKSSVGVIPSTPSTSGSGFNFTICI